MGRIVVTEYVSVDGVVEAPSGTETFERVGWTDAFTRGPEGDQFKLDEARASDALLLGRVTYDGFAPVWPHHEGEVADKLNSMPKYVISSTLADPEWNNTTVLRGDVVEEVTTLKEKYRSRRVPRRPDQDFRPLQGAAPRSRGKRRKGASADALRAVVSSIESPEPSFETSHRIQTPTGPRE